MAANVETMFYTRVKPWHGLGTLVAEAPTSAEALALAGLDWQVIQKDLLTADGFPVEGFKANVRQSDDQVLGVVTNRYKVVQNQDAFAFTDALLGEGVRYETAGSLQNGRRIWILAKLPQRYIISGDEVTPYLVFMNSHNGTGAINEAMRQGRDLEEYVARRFTEATGLKVRRSNCMYRSVEHPWMIADVDRLIVGEDAGLECKTASAYSADKWKDGEIPAHYLIQCYHYMAVTGKRAWYIAVAILGKEFKYARIDWENEVIQNLIKIEEAFWNEHIVPKVMPDPDGSKICDEVLEHYFHAVRKGSEIPLVGFDDQLRRREELKRLIDQMEREKSQIDQRIKLYMKDSESAANEHYRVTWTPVNTVRLDTKLLKAEEPEIYREYLKTTSTRRFSVSAA